MRLLALLLTLSSPALADGPFWPHWSDGKAELSGYDLVQPRYGEKRHGRAVLIFVTEPFSRARGVKVDQYNPNDPDHFTALKLNAVRKFQTGIYDYSVMTSVFADPSRGFAPVKVSFSSQEWCGHVYEEARFGEAADVRVDSYFEGETRAERVAVAGAEDGLFITLRELAAPTLAGQPASAPLLPSALDRRLRHQPVKAAAIGVQWGPSTSVTVPAGTFAVRTATWTRGVGGQCQADIEEAYPHRIIGWRCDDGEQARLLGSERIPYWQTHGEGDEALLGRLGLKPMGVAP
ncbi:MAG: hypothetical protein R3F60_01335 [bacterium]